MSGPLFGAERRTEGLSLPARLGSLGLAALLATATCGGVCLLCWLWLTWLLGPAPPTLPPPEPAPGLQAPSGAPIPVQLDVEP